MIERLNVEHWPLLPIFHWDKKKSCIEANWEWHMLYGLLFKQDIMQSLSAEKCAQGPQPWSWVTWRAWVYEWGGGLNLRWICHQAYSKYQKLLFLPKQSWYRPTEMDLSVAAASIRASAHLAGSWEPEVDPLAALPWSLVLYWCPWEWEAWEWQLEGSWVGFETSTPGTGSRGWGGCRMGWLRCQRNEAVHPMGMDIIHCPSDIYGKQWACWLWSFVQPAHPLLLSEQESDQPWLGTCAWHYHKHSW